MIPRQMIAGFHHLRLTQWRRARPLKFALAAVLFTFPLTAFAQTKAAPSVIREPQLTRTINRHEVRRFSYGGTVTIVGPPESSFVVEGWNRDEVEVRAEIQLRADSEADLDKLAAVNTFVVDDDANHIRVLSTGTHDKAFMRNVAKKFPKPLLGLPWKIDFRIRVPMLTALDINAGRGPITLSGIEGHIRVTANESEVKANPMGGTLGITVGRGRVQLAIETRSWRGVGGDVRVAIGDINCELPPGFNGDIDADILRVGQITETFGLTSREKPGVTPQKVRGRAGSGGAFFSFTVGDGVINIKKQITEGQ